MSLFTFGVVAGSESLSFPVWFVISSLATESYSLDIHATFVKILSLSVSASAVTSHSISIVSESSLLFEYAFISFVPVVENVTLFVVSLFHGQLCYHFFLQ